MKNNFFPNSLIFIIAAGVLFVAGSYVLFGINESTGKPRVFNWIPYSSTIPERQNRTYEVTLETSLGNIKLQTLSANESEKSHVGAFISYLQKISTDPSTFFVFTHVENGGFIRAVPYKKSSESSHAQTLYSQGTVAVMYAGDGSVEDFIILLEESTLPEKYVAVGTTFDDTGSVSAIGSLPRNSCDALLNPVQVSTIIIQQSPENDQNSDIKKPTIQDDDQTIHKTVE